MTGQDKNRKMGLSRFGQVPALRIAIPAGVALAVLIGVVQMLINPPGPMRGWIVPIMALCLATPCVMGVWVLIVDRSTLPGAVRNPEASIENSWYNKAASATFNMALAVSGVGASVASLMRATVVSWTLIGVFGALAAGFGISYLVVKSRS